MISVYKAGAVAVFFVAAALFAQEKNPLLDQTVRVSGIVSDAASAAPVPGAVIAIPEFRLSASSDSSGAFVIDSVPASANFLIATAKGFMVGRINFAKNELSALLQVKLHRSVPSNGTVQGSDNAGVATTAALTASGDSDRTGAAGSAQERSLAPKTRLITGKVVDKKTGNPIAEAIVSVSELAITVPSGPQGEFSIAAPNAACTLTAVKTGFGQSGVLADSGTATMSVRIELAQSALYELQELDVSADRIKVKQMVKTSEKISQVKMSPELISKLPAIGQADVFRSLQLLPGVSGTNEASAGLFVRGGTPDQNLIILNQMPVYYVDHFYGFFSAFNPNAVSDVTFHKGGFGSRYGGRLSSVVELSSRGMEVSSDSFGLLAGAGMGLLSGDAYLQVPIINKNIGTLMVAGRRAMTDVFKTDLFNRIFNRMHGTDTTNSMGGSVSTKPTGPWMSISHRPEFYFWDINGLAAFKLGSRGTLTTTLFRSLDRQDNSIDTTWSTRNIIPSFDFIMDTVTRGKPTYDTIRLDTNTITSVMKNKAPISWGNSCIGQEWEQAWSEVFKTRLAISYSQFVDEKKEDDLRTDSTADRFSDTTDPHDTTIGAVTWMSSRNTITDISGRFDNSIKLWDWNTLNAGMEFSSKTVAYDRDTAQPDTTGPEWQWMKYMTLPQLRRIRSHDTSVSWALYAEDEMKLGDKAGLTPGLRLNRFELASAFALDPRLSAWYKPLPGLKLKAAWGLYSQEIHRAEEEDITGGSKFVWLLAGGGRPLEKSRQAVAGAAWETAHFLIDVEAYLKRMSGLLTISERMSSSQMTGRPFDPGELPLFEGTGLARGVELLVQVKNAVFSLLSKDAIYDGWLAYTWSRVENTYAVFNDGNPFPATYDHPHEIKLVNTLEWNVSTWSGVELGAVWLYSTGAPYTAPLGVYNLMMLDSSWARSYNHVSEKNAYRLPDYHRLDLSAAWRVRFGRCLEGRLALGLFNAYNHENILERTYKTSYVGGGGGWIKIPSGTMAPVYIAEDRKAMSIMPNAAVELRARF